MCRASLQTMMQCPYTYVQAPIDGLLHIQEFKNLSCYHSAIMQVGHWHVCISQVSILLIVTLTSCMYNISFEQNQFSMYPAKVLYTFRPVARIFTTGGHMGVWCACGYACLSLIKCGRLGGSGSMLPIACRVLYLTFGCPYMDMPSQMTSNTPTRNSRTTSVVQMMN